MDIYIIDQILVLFVTVYTISLPTRLLSPQPNEGEGAQLAPLDILNRMTVIVVVVVWPRYDVYIRDF